MSFDLWGYRIGQPIWNLVHPDYRMPMPVRMATVGGTEKFTTVDFVSFCIMLQLLFAALLSSLMASVIQYGLHHRSKSRRHISVGSMNPRFSLRGLLLLTVAVAAFCWYRDLPRQNANRFAKLIEAGNYEAARQVLPSSWTFTDLKAARNGQLPRDWLRGRYPLTVVVNATNGRTYTVDVEASATGIERLYDFGIDPTTPRAANAPRRPPASHTGRSADTPLAIATSDSVFHSSSGFTSELTPISGRSTVFDSNVRQGLLNREFQPRHSSPS